METTVKVVLARHGESAWNKSNRFCGWVDVPLSPQGYREAALAAEAITAAGFVQFDLIFTSLLERATEMTRVIVDHQRDHHHRRHKAMTGGRDGLDLDDHAEAWTEPRIVRDWRLNERHYGGLTGLNKAEMAEIHGVEQVQVWRRSYDLPPPTMTSDHPYYEAINGNEKFREVPQGRLPDRESLKDVVHRIIPCWEEAIAPAVRSGLRVLVVAHGTSLRALVKVLEGLSDAQVQKLNLPNWIPFYYELEVDSLKPLDGSTRVYLADEEVVRKAEAKTASIGTKPPDT